MTATVWKWTQPSQTKLFPKPKPRSGIWKSVLNYELLSCCKNNVCDVFELALVRGKVPPTSIELEGHWSSRECFWRGVIKTVWKRTQSVLSPFWVRSEGIFDPKRKVPNQCLRKLSWFLWTNNTMNNGIPATKYAFLSDIIAKKINDFLDFRVHKFPEFTKIHEFQPK